MKHFRLSMLVLALVAPMIIFAQEDKKDVKEEKVTKTEKGDKGDKKDGQTIIITRKDVSNDKNVVVEVKGDKVYVDGKLVDEKNKNNDVNVRVMKVRDTENFRYPRSRNLFTTTNGFNFDYSADKAMLGVTTQEVEGGVEVQSVTKGSGAEKAGIKEKDIITMINDDKIEDPDDLTEAVQKYKAGDKISVSLLRDKKPMKLTAELSSWKSTMKMDIAGFKNFNVDMGDIERYLPRTPIAPRIWTGNGPRLGLSVQDNDDGKGVKVTEVDQEDSYALKAGIKVDDIIIEGEGKPINNADDMVNLVRQNKDKVSITLKIVRNGKTQDIVVKMPRKLRTADL